MHWPTRTLLYELYFHVACEDGIGLYWTCVCVQHDQSSLYNWEQFYNLTALASLLLCDDRNRLFTQKWSGRSLLACCLVLAKQADCTTRQHVHLYIHPVCGFTSVEHLHAVWVVVLGAYVFNEDEG